MIKKILILVFISLGGWQVQAACTLAVTVQGAITASTVDYLFRAQKKAQDNNCESLFIRLNTPGGSLQSTRLLVEQIIASDKPYLCLISPTGAHAASAGAIILQACHVNGGLPTTHLGAATPVAGGGQEIPEDLKKKLMNDTITWLESLTKLRGRNLDFSKEIITEAKTLGVEAAVQQKALDILATHEGQFLEQAQGRKVRIGENEKPVVTGQLIEFPPDLRYQVLNFVADPEFAYLLFMGSLGLLYVELTHPGLIAPGVLGGIGLVLSLVAFHKLDVAWGGLALIVLGIAFLILELFVTSFGILAIGGLAAIFFGSLFLFDAQSTGYSLPLSLILSVVGVLAAFIFGIGYLTLKTLRHRSRDADTELQTHLGKVINVQVSGLSGQVEIQGEIWSFKSAEGMQVGDPVRVLSRQGLVLKIVKA